MTITIYNREAFNAAPNLVVFDLDNTLYPYDAPHRAALESAATKAKALVGIARAEFIAIYEAARQEIGERLKGTAASHSRLQYFIRMAEMFGIGAQPAIALDLEQTYWMAFLNNAELFPDVIEFLEDLRLATIPTAMVTDLTTQIQCRKLVYWGLDRYFSTVVTSEEAGLDKPAAAPFELLISKLGELPSVVWFIGDDVDKDVVAAKRYLRAITLLRVSQLGALEPVPQLDLTFTEFQSVRKFISQLNRPQTQS